MGLFTELELVNSKDTLLKEGERMKFHFDLTEFEVSVKSKCKSRVGSWKYRLGANKSLPS